MLFAEEVGFDGEAEGVVNGQVVFLNLEGFFFGHADGDVGQLGALAAGLAGQHDHLPPDRGRYRKRPECPD